MIFKYFPTSTTKLHFLQHLKTKTNDNAISVAIDVIDTKLLQKPNYPTLEPIRGIIFLLYVRSSFIRRRPTNKIFFAITLASSFSSPWLFFFFVVVVGRCCISVGGLRWPSLAFRKKTKRKKKKKKKKREAQQRRSGWMRLSGGGGGGGGDGRWNRLKPLSAFVFISCLQTPRLMSRAVPPSSSSEWTRIKRQERARPPRSLSFKPTTSFLCFCSHFFLSRECVCARFSFERSCRKTVYSVLAGMSSQANCCCFCCYFFFCEQQREKERERMQLRQKWAPLTYNDFVVGIAVCLYATFLLCKTPFSRSPLQPLLTPPRFDCMFLLEPDTHTTIITRFVSLSLCTNFSCHTRRSICESK